MSCPSEDDPAPTHPHAYPEDFCAPTHTRTRLRTTRPRPRTTNESCPPRIKSCGPAPSPRPPSPCGAPTYHAPCPSSCRIFSSTACSAAARHALVSSSFCRALSPGEAPSSVAGTPEAATAAAARGGLAGTCSAGTLGDGGLAGLALSEGGVLAGLARAAGGWRAGDGAGDGLGLPDCSPATALAGLGAVGGGGGLGDTGGGVPCARFTSAERAALESPQVQAHWEAETPPPAPAFPGQTCFHHSFPILPPP